MSDRGRQRRAEDAEWAALEPSQRHEKLMAELIGEVRRIRQIVVAAWVLTWISVAIVVLSALANS